MDNFVESDPMPPALENADEISVLIPAAGPVADGVMALSNVSCPAMVPVAGRPVIYWTISYLRSFGLRHFCIAVSQRDLFIEDFVAHCFGKDINVKFIVPSRDGGLGFTVRELAENAATESSLVVLGDTHFQFEDPDVLTERLPFVLTEVVEESYRWCTVETDQANEITNLNDKVSDLASSNYNALIGVYYFPETEVLAEKCRLATRNSETNTRITTMADVLQFVAEDQRVRAIRAGAWLDCGNPDRAAESHRSLLQNREFNDLSIDPTMGTITKRSRNVEKFIDEINYIRLLPSELSVLFPRVIDYSCDWEDPYVKLEYYGYPSLAEVFVFENVDPGIWEQVFAHLSNIVSDGFMQRKRPISRQDMYDMYIAKTKSRLENLRASPELIRIVNHDGPIHVNGMPMANLSQLWIRLESEIEQLAKEAQGNVIHGDMCFSNILYDLRSRICKLIDPRGSFGTAGLYGDSRYDVAKLFHSVYGLYDFITQDLFRVEVDGMSIKLEICSRPEHQLICEKFEKVFFRTFERREILILTGILFASMPALHYDEPKRQVAMYARALQLFDEAF